MPRSVNVFSVIDKAMETDPEGCSALINEVVYSYLTDLAEEYRPEIAAITDELILERTAIAKRALGRSYVSTIASGKYPDEDVHKSAKWIRDIEAFVVSKAADEFEREYNGRNVRVKANRDARGRFSRGVKYDVKENVVMVGTQRLAPALREANIFSEDKNGKRTLNPDVASDAATKDLVDRHQAQWQEANTIAGDILENFSSGERSKIDLLFNLQKPDGATYQKIVPADAYRKGKLSDDAGWKYSDLLQSIEVGVAPNVSFDDPVSNRVAAYNTLGTVGGQTLAQVANVDPARLRALQESMNRNQPREKSGITRLFNRLAAGGSVLEQIDPLSQYGQWAKFVGTLGPEAESVLGPYVQQAAYRYRGTEKEPDQALMADFNGQTMRAVEVAATTRDPKSKISEAITNAGLEGKTRQGRNDLVMQSASHQISNLSRTRGGTYTPDELLLNVRSDVAARHLLNTLPTDPFVAEVSRKAGQILPSQGVIIDADGDVVSQAVGFSDDHYLPFDFKNLSSLRGGQYVRTRQQGGLTAEDIYTSIRSNARMATVVSSSGVFSLEFDPNFRGARASSDKAKQMYDRYIKILDAIDASGLYVQDISPAEREKVQATVRDIVGNDNSPEYRNMLKTALNEKRMEAKTITDDRLKELEQEAVREVQGENRKYSEDRFQRRVSDVFDELVNEERTRMVSELRLNSKGYEVALQTLQQQFPYFIRNVSFQPLTSKIEGQGFLQNLAQPGAAGARQKLGASDTGYVQPGGLRASSLKQGTYRYAPETMAYKDGYVSGDATTTAAPTTSTSNATTTATTGTGAKPTVSVASDLPKTGLAANIAKLANSKKTEASTVFKDFGYQVIQIPTARIKEALPEDATWDDVKDNDTMAFRFLVDPIHVDAANKVFANNIERVAELLSNKELVSSQIPAMFDPVNMKLTGVFDDNKAYGDYVLETGKKLKDLAAYSKPFVAPIKGNEGNYYTGNVPQLFSEINNATSHADLANFLQSDDDAMRIAGILNDARDVTEKARDIIDVLQSAPAIINEIKADTTRKVGPITAAEIGDASGISPADLNDVFGEDIGDENITQSKLDSLARSTQKAWSVLTAGKFISEAGGEEAPKVRKSLRGHSSPLELVSKVQRLRSLNLPLT